MAACFIFFKCVNHLSCQRYCLLGGRHEKPYRSKAKWRHSLGPPPGDPGNAVARCRWWRVSHTPGVWERRNETHLREKARWESYYKCVTQTESKLIKWGNWQALRKLCKYAMVNSIIYIRRCVKTSLINFILDTQVGYYPVYAADGLKSTSCKYYKKWLHFSKGNQSSFG